MADANTGDVNTSDDFHYTATATATTTGTGTSLTDLNANVTDSAITFTGGGATSDQILISSGGSTVGWNEVVTSPFGIGPWSFHAEPNGDLQVSFSRGKGETNEFYISGKKILKLLYDNAHLVTGPPEEE